MKSLLSLLDDLITLQEDISDRYTKDEVFRKRHIDDMRDHLEIAEGLLRKHFGYIEQ